MRMRTLLLMIPLLFLFAATSRAGTVPRSPKDICDELPCRPKETVQQFDWQGYAANIKTDYIRWPNCCDEFWPYGLGLSNGAAAAATAGVFVGCD